jgi:hypothetical protein
MVLGAVVLTAGAVTVGHRTDLPGQTSPEAEVPRADTSEIRPRRVQTVAIGPDGSVLPASAERAPLVVQGRPVAQADIDRARANLEQGLRDLRAKAAQDPNATLDPTSWTGSVADRSGNPSLQDDETSAAQAESRDAASADAARPSKPAAKPAREPDGAGTGPRVVIHWPKQDGGSAKLAKDIARDFKENGWTIAALKPVGSSVRRTEVRHPGGNARSQADQAKSELANWLKAEGHSANIVLSHRRTEQNAIEVWLPKSSQLGRAPVQGHRTKRKTASKSRRR